jgi:hypothetical protein
MKTKQALDIADCLSSWLMPDMFLVIQHKIESLSPEQYEAWLNSDDSLDEFIASTKKEVHPVFAQIVNGFKNVNFGGVR